MKLSYHSYSYFFFFLLLNIMDPKDDCFVETHKSVELFLVSNICLYYVTFGQNSWLSRQSFNINEIYRIFMSILENPDPSVIQVSVLQAGS